MIFGICFAYQTNWFAKCTLITQIPWPYSTSRIGKVRGDETNYELELKQECSYHPSFDWIVSICPLEIATTKLV